MPWAVVHWAMLSIISTMTTLKLSTSLPRFSTHFHHFSTQKYAISTIKQNEVLPYFFLSVWRSQKQKYLFTLLHKKWKWMLKIGRSAMESGCRVHLEIGKRRDLGSVSIKKIKRLALTHLSHKSWNICCFNKSNRPQKWCYAFHP